MSWPLCAVVAATACKISVRLAASRPTLLYRLAASRMQIEPGWPPVACNMGKIGAHLLATGGHPRSICIRLAAKRQRRGGRLAASRMLILYAARGHPGAICMRLAASRTQLLCRLAASRMQMQKY